MMITDHEGSSRQLKAALPPGAALPSQLDAQDQARLQGLRNTPAGAAFDRAYMQQQVMAHEQALTLHQNYARDGEAPQLRQVASSIAPVVDNHLRTARSMVR